MVKTTPADFQKFKSYALLWQKRLGLIEWALYFKHNKSTDAYARTGWHMEGMIATVTLATYWDELREISDVELNKLALHEIMHVAMAPLIDLAESRYVTQDAIDAAEHSLIRRIETLFADTIV